MAKQQNRTRRVASRVAVAGALVVVPLSAVAVPAFADTPDNSATAVALDRGDHHGDRGDRSDHRGPDRGEHRDHRNHDVPPAPALPPLPPTGSAG
ncbi:hypothetical protein HGA08_06700 [Nocardia vermiculata]|uniref:Uncharacterized protein n=1 Tax=Nocardia vermiculata TaxID=257274 RepID=A0A846XWY9_9NOCA|nr:hypothetical protein [Nocardia vermiculata]